jgi:hypothetical protein
MTLQDLKKLNAVSAAPNGIRGDFVRNPYEGGKWQHVDAIRYGGEENSYASYSDEDILPTAE